MQITLNGQPRELPDGATVGDLIRELGLAPEQVAVERNRELVGRDRRDETRLSSGDRLEVVTLVGGG